MRAAANCLDLRPLLNVVPSNDKLRTKQADKESRGRYYECALLKQTFDGGTSSEVHAHRTNIDNLNSLRPKP